MKCEKCGCEINRLEVDEFCHDGSDCYCEESFQECENNAVVMDLDLNWVGTELSCEEMTETIRCPKCKQFPFKNREIQCYHYVKVVCFKGE